MSSAPIRPMSVALVTPKVVARLQAFLIKDGGSDQCWPFTGCRSDAGYGRIGIGRGILYQAHRVAYIAHYKQPLSPDDLVLHTCDNPPCCNPAHLWVGTYKDNSDDMRSKGRAKYGTSEEISRRLKGRAATGARHAWVTHPEKLPKGIGHGMHKLTDEQVREIRTAVAAGSMQSVLADKYQVCRQTICNIVHRANWKHLP